MKKEYLIPVIIGVATTLIAQFIYDKFIDKDTTDK